MDNFIMPAAAQRKLKAARSLWQTAYVYGATGYGKTSAVKKHLGRRRHVYLSCADRSWDVSAFPASEQGRQLVVIDDLHLLNEERRDLVRSLVSRHDIWLILVSRSPVPSWLMPEYINIGFMIISESDLCLGKQEIAGYLDSLAIEYTGEDLDTLQKSTQGNVYTLRHSALRMKEGMKPGPELYKEVHDAFIRYLEEYVMAEWDSELLEFLMQVSVVDEFTLPLAEMITANRSALTMLQKAAEAGNFLSQEDGTYRLRDLLLHALRDRAMKVLGSERVKALAKNAGLYYEMDGDIARALAMYEFSGNQAQIRELLIRNARENPGTGHYYELRHYYLTMDPQEAERSPVLMAGLSMLHSMLMDPEKSELWYDKLKQFTRSATGGMKREAQSRLAYLEIGLPHRGSKDVLNVMRGVGAMLLDNGVGLPEFSVTSNIPSTMNGGKDFCQWSRSDRTLARTIAPLVERVLGRYGKGLTKAALGESLYEKGADHLEVLTLLSRAQLETEGGGKQEIAFSAVGQRVRLAVLRGDLANANNLLDSFQSAVEDNGARQLLPNIEALRCRLALYAANHSKLERWLKSAPNEDKEFITMERYRYLTKVRCYLALGEDEKALSLLEKLSAYAELYHRAYIRMETGFLGAIVRRRLGMEWQDMLKRALDEAESYRFVRMISELGPAILPLLKEHQRDGPWFGQVAAETQLVAKRYPRYLRPLPSGPGGFSRTAREILRLQAAGLSVTQIAENLDMKPDNVRYHIKENYRKLEVCDKVDAIAAAKSVGLI